MTTAIATTVDEERPPAWYFRLATWRLTLSMAVSFIATSWRGGDAGKLQCFASRGSRKLIG
jgi:hypothetical protein